MKKNKNSCFLVLIILILLCSCGNKNGNVSKSDNSTNNEETITIDKNLVDVSITLPNSFFEAMDTNAEDYVESLDSTLFKKSVINSDGSVTITMSKANHEKYMNDMKVSFDESLQEMANDDSLSIDSIEHDDDFQTFTLKLSKNEVGFAESFSAIAIAMLGGVYQTFNGSQNSHVVVNYLGPDGNLLNTWDSDSLSE